MPATEETYRRQPILHLVFAISSIAMLLSIVWMVAADHLRPWKQVQREFQQVEREKLKASREEKLEEQKAKNQAQIDEVDAKIKAGRGERRGAGQRDPPARSGARQAGRQGPTARHAAAVQEGRAGQQAQPLRRHDRPQRGGRGAGLPRQRRLGARSASSTSSPRSSRRPKSDEGRDRGQEGRPARPHRRTSRRSEERLTREADRVERAIEQKDALYGGSDHWYSQPMAFLRSLPGIDLMPPTKIQQISLPELTINYNFKEVPRYDRCTTCHQGIDRLGYDKAADGKPMKPRSSPSHPHLTVGRHHDRPQGERRPGGPLPRRQRPAPDQQLRLHDLPRRPGLGDRLHLLLAHAQLARSRRRSGRRKHDWH